MIRWTAQAPLLEQIELLRLEATGRLDPVRRIELGQFLTPAPLAQLMSAMLPPPPTHVRLLDAGAGVGSLLAAGVEALAQAVHPPERIEITAYELDPLLHPCLSVTLKACKQFCDERWCRLQSAPAPMMNCLSCALCPTPRWCNRATQSDLFGLSQTQRASTSPAAWVRSR